jgi:hypothetical protein
MGAEVEYGEAEIKECIPLDRSSISWERAEVFLSQWWSVRKEEYFNVQNQTKERRTEGK